MARATRRRSHKRYSKTTNSHGSKQTAQPFFDFTSQHTFFSPKSPASSVLRKCDDCKKEDNRKVQRSQNTASAKVTPSNVASYVHSLSGKGSPLPNNTRQFFEPKFNASFSSVRVHSNEESSKAASSIHAKAFTYKNHIVFNKGQFDAESSTGKKLLAHELTHVLQQDKGISRMEAEQKEQEKIQRTPTEEEDTKTKPLETKDDKKKEEKKIKLTGCTKGRALHWGCDTTCLLYGFIDSNTPFVDRGKGEKGEKDCCNKWPPFVEGYAISELKLDGVASCRPGKNKQIAVVKYKGKQVRVGCMDTVPTSSTQLIELSPFAAIALYGKLQNANVEVCYEGKINSDKLCYTETPTPAYPSQGQCVEKRCSPQNPFDSCSNYGWPQK